MWVEFCCTHDCEGDLNFAAYMIVKAIPLHVILQVEEVVRLLDNGQLVDVGDLWTGTLVKCPVCYLRSEGVGWV